MLRVLLAVVAPDWLRSQVQPEWLERYGHRAEDYRLPTSTEKRQALPDIHAGLEQRALLAIRSIWWMQDTPMPNRWSRLRKPIR